jgi:hypothetical protein
VAPDQERQGYSTNLASEFFVLSVLYRLGLAANLTLGNKKGVDIVVACGPGRAITIEVKAVAGKNDWLVGKLGLEPRDHHYVVLVSYEAKFSDPDESPKVWIFAHDEIVPLIRTSKTGSARYISRKEVREKSSGRAQDWDRLRRAAL